MKTLKRKSYEWGLELAGINTYHKASILKRVRYWQMNRRTNGMEPKVQKQTQIHI